MTTYVRVSFVFFLRADDVHGDEPTHTKEVLTFFFPCVVALSIYRDDRCSIFRNRGLFSEQRSETTAVPQVP